MFLSDKILSQNPSTQGNLGDILQDNIFPPENKSSIYTLNYLFNMISKNCDLDIKEDFKRKREFP